MDAFDFVHSDALFDIVSGSGPGSGIGITFPSAADRRSHDGQQHRNHAWPPVSFDDAEAMAHAQPSSIDDFDRHFQHQTLRPSQPTSEASRNVSQPPPPQQPAGLPIPYANLINASWQFQMDQTAIEQQQQLHLQAEGFASAPMSHAVDVAALQSQPRSSPIDFVPSTAAPGYAVTAPLDVPPFMAMTSPMDSMQSLRYPLNDYDVNGAHSMALNTAVLHQHLLDQQAVDTAQSSLSGSSPTGTMLEVQSVSDHEWSMVNVKPHRYSLESVGTVSNPSLNLHIRTHSDSSSDDPGSAELSGSYEDATPWPTSSPHDLHGSDYLDAQYIQQQTQNMLTGAYGPHASAASMSVSPSAGRAAAYPSSTSPSTSPTSSGPTSPPLRRRRPTADPKTTKAVIKKIAAGLHKDSAAEKKVGRRRGPLRPDQRQQAHEIRKLRACLRCKFLKKTCDKGEPCAGCRPSHARLWQVPCTRMDIKDIAYFMKDWKADYERHLSLGFSVGNIRGFGKEERTLYITHGYGHYLPIMAREVLVSDNQCFGVDWVESIHAPPRPFEQKTAKLSAGIEGVSTSVLSEYLDRHLDQTFETFVDEHFEGTFFVTEILKTVHRYYVKEQTPAIRKALKLLLAYNLTQHLTMVESGAAEGSPAAQMFGRIAPGSRWAGMAAAPVMINFQVKCALAAMWRDLQRDVLEELSSLYSSVYSGDKLRNWPTIFMLATVLLAIWEEMQFDCHYRVLDAAAVDRFCDEMETTPVGVVVGLFQAISTKLPAINDWDTRKHHHLLNSNSSVCDALTEVRTHVQKYDKYLRERSSATFDREDFDCLSNKFLCKLVIRAN